MNSAESGEEAPDPEVDPICSCGHHRSLHTDRECEAVECPCQVFRPST